ncbi:HK97 family phage prohead protease [Clostridium sp. D46t1_190503_E9]|uniref:HK97 family phage prohead protease n=1 Tax=Clostridium sp. D46t1_190503_E9 TaxID=2787137 RepID=UPI001897B6D3|nr:HK97 family phage prohead protease [Clostridium sp. D46t1_190503_E9]
MIETRILQDEIRSLRASNIEIRMDKNHIYICGSLPIRSLSHPITDRKTGKKFREIVEPSAFKLALMSNKAHGYKTKLLKNHSYNHEFEYENELEFDEVDERELRFLFTLPKSQRNLELLEDVSEDNASFSFGFICGNERKASSNEKGIDYIRIIDSFQELREISILDKWTLGAYSSARGFKAGSYASAEKKAQKFVLNKNRESLYEKQDKKLQEIKSYIEKQRRNDLFRFGASVKISMN